MRAKCITDPKRLPTRRGAPPQRGNEGGFAQRPQPRRYGRWRAASLIAVYVLMTAHIVHWRLAGRTLAPLELNEVMYTLEAGIVTAGFIFMSLAVVSVLIFGRFFCSWGCHILALQDLCAWLMEKAHIRPKPVRSRVLLLVPVGAMLYMFVWPQVVRLIITRQPAPQWRILGDGEGWASFVTSDFWRNLPGAGVALLTFAVCGFGIVYLLGSRAFCTYACPYGAAFAIADRFAVGRIKAVGERTACEDCGLCTAVCESHIRVHTELTVFGKVVSPACLKDLDCVSVCPNGSIIYGFTMPSFFRSWRKFGRFGVPYDFTVLEDVLMAATFLAGVIIFRGLYDLVPFLLSLAIGAIFAWGLVMALRLVTRQDLRIGRAQLKRGGRITSSGASFAVLTLFALAFSAHSAIVQYHESGGRRYMNAVHASQQVDPTALDAAIGHLQVSERLGLIRSPQHTEQLALALLQGDEPRKARPLVERLLAARPERHDWRVRLAAVLLIERRAPEAVAHLQAVVTWTTSATDPFSRAACRDAHRMLDEIAAAIGDGAAAEREFAAAAAFERTNGSESGAEKPAGQPTLRTSSSVIQESKGQH